MPKSYILLSIKVDGNVEEALSDAIDLLPILEAHGYDHITVLNTIPAPE